MLETETKIPHGAEIYRTKDGWRVILRNSTVGYEKHQAHGKTLEEATNNLLKEISQFQELIK